LVSTKLPPGKIDEQKPALEIHYLKRKAAQKPFEITCKGYYTQSDWFGQVRAYFLLFG